MSSLALTSGWYYIYTLYCTPDMNAVMVNLNHQVGFAPRQDSYTMNVDHRINYYNCKGFGYISKNCRNQRFVGQKRGMEYKDNLDNGDNCNLNREENLIVLDQILTVIGLQCSLE